MIDEGERPAARLRAVLDTSALLSEHRHWLWLLARLRYYEAAWSTFIVGELVRIRVEHGVKHGVGRVVYRQRVNDLIHVLSDVLLVVNYRGVSVAGSLPDPDDEPILATALAARADCIVSLNTRDFPPGGETAGVRFVTPAALLAALESKYPDAELRELADQCARHLP